MTYLLTALCSAFLAPGLILIYIWSGAMWGKGSAFVLCASMLAVCILTLYSLLRGDEK